MTDPQKLQLYGFNNLTKSMSFSLYKLHYISAVNVESISQYNNYINELYSAINLSEMLNDVAIAIGATVLNVAKQEYQPQGASVTMMISEEATPDSLVSHLDKSHLCIHTYPEDNITDNVAIFRCDIELSTCGLISPLKVINKVISYFNADLVDIDYRIRGMTRDTSGRKHFIDGPIQNISEELSSEIKENYHVTNENLPQRKLYFAQLTKKKCDLTSFAFGQNNTNFNENNDKQIKQRYHEETQQLSLT